MTLAIFIIAFILGAAWCFIVASVLDGDKEVTNEKPIIRHCKNCEWCKTYWGCSGIDCKITYKTIFNQRIKALLCRYYKQKSETGSSIKEGKP